MPYADTRTNGRRHLAGEYVDAAYGIATVRVEGDSLKWAWSSWTLTLAHYQGDTFRLKADHPELNGLFVRFIVEDGVVQQMGIFGRTFAKK